MPPLATESGVPSVSEPKRAVVAKRFVLDAVVANKLVLVALVVMSEVIEPLLAVSVGIVADDA